MAGILALPFLGGAGAAGAGAGAASAAAGPTMAEILAQAAQAPATGAVPTIASGVSQAGPGIANSQFLNYLDKGIRLGQLAGMGGQPSAAPATVGGGNNFNMPAPPAPQMPNIQAQPYQPTATAFLEDLLRRGV